MNITGQSIRTEPMVLGNNKLFAPTSLERYNTAKRGGSRSSKSVYDLEITHSRKSPAMATTETLQRTLAQNPRQQVYSNGIMTAPLISGLASNEINRPNENRDGRDIMNTNTRIVETNTPMIINSDIY